MTPKGPAPKRRPGDGNDFDRQADPRPQFLGDHSVEGGGGLVIAVDRLIRALFRRRR